MERKLAQLLPGQHLREVRRRAKYLLIELDRGTLIAHLGMSGSLRVLPADTPWLKHDHYELRFDKGGGLRFNDPRRFGSLHWVRGDPMQHPLLAGLGPEPLGRDFDDPYVAARAKGRRVAIKQFLMDQRIVVGVGNIYAAEALFRAGVRPTTPAGRLSRARIAALVDAVREVLAEAIARGGSTLRDFVDSDGEPGSFQLDYRVYGREGEPCRVCHLPGQRHGCCLGRSPYGGHAR